MKKLLLVLVVAALSVPAQGGIGVYKAVMDGSYDSYRDYDAVSGAWIGEGYSNGGEGSAPRLCKANQQLGWFYFGGAVDSNDPSITLSAFLAANPNLTPKFWFRFYSATPCQHRWHLGHLLPGQPAVRQPGRPGQ